MLTGVIPRRLGYARLSALRGQGSVGFSLLGFLAVCDSGRAAGPVGDGGKRGSCRCPAAAARADEPLACRGPVPCTKASSTPALACPGGGPSLELILTSTPSTLGGVA